MARVISVADAFDGITSTRSYQKKKTTKESIQVLKENAGTQFDREVVNVAASVLFDETSD